MAFGGDGDDQFTLADGNDAAHGEAGADYLNGGIGNDYLDGGLSDDQIYGGDGNDTLVGGAGQDQLIAGSGDNRIVGGAGNDWMQAGTGPDTFIFNPQAYEHDVIESFDGAHDKIEWHGTQNLGITETAAGVEIRALDGSTQTILLAGLDLAGFDQDCLIFA